MAEQVCMGRGRLFDPLPFDDRNITREIKHLYVDSVVTYHRTISTLINTLIKHDFVLEEIIEPQSTPAGLEKNRSLIINWREKNLPTRFGRFLG
ncbi:hypothetical protein ELQ35_05245 [Peribacillus cavernae]|uniref:Uncharacterized protein n=1 Tax=Peribacillus cavernae TaxID=1674310 RepID=A0A3S0VMH1_9BACI|nr:hypothetical protein [Peribacillus cavernae]RUQ30996.1 hypothetical protein ELQ35_05245 [Peribacillus cavernae]